MNFSQFIHILSARWKIVSLIFIVTVAAAVGITLVLPKTYTATAALVIDLKSDPLVGQSYPGILIASYMATQVDVLKSDRVARRVIKTLGFLDNPKLKEKWQESSEGRGDFETWVINAFRKATDIKPSRESSVIEVTYKTDDPKIAALTANTIVQSYIETNRELRVDPAKQSSSFFDQRARQARDTVEQAQAKLSAYQRAKGIVGGMDRLDVEQARMNEYSAQLVALQGLSAESSSRQNQAGAGDTLQDVINNPLVSGLRSDLSRQEARLQELTARFGDNHPQVVEARASINELRQRVATETRRVVGGVGMNNRINQQRVAEVRALYETQRAKVLRMQDQRDEGAVLQREVENAQRSYDQLLTRVNQSNLESQDTLTNVSVLNLASEPVEPSSPKTLLNIGAAVFLGLILGAGAALILEFMNRKVRSVDDVIQSLGLPVLGIMPAPDSRRLSGGQSMLARGVLGQLPAPPKRA
ncbi:hypothetical protein BH09PSE5_BH09PSE5_41340 [soil metagenome]